VSRTKWHPLSLLSSIHSFRTPMLDQQVIVHPSPDNPALSMEMFVRETSKEQI